MPRNISFWLTQQQFLGQTKYVTRRSAWDNLTPGTILMGCQKCQGLGKGGTITRLGEIRVLSIRPEPLGNITKADLVLEGFPRMTRLEFIKMYMDANKHVRSFSSLVNRIEYEYLEPIRMFSPGHLWCGANGAQFEFVAIAGGHVWGEYRNSQTPAKFELSNFLWMLNHQWIWPIEHTDRTEIKEYPSIQTLIRMHSGDLNK